MYELFYICKGSSINCNIPCILRSTLYPFLFILCDVTFKLFPISDIIVSYIPEFNIILFSYCIQLKYCLSSMICTFLCPRDEESGGGHINFPLSVCPSGYRYMVCSAISSYSFFHTSCIKGTWFVRLLLQFQSYSFNILQDIYTHNGGMHVHRILIFIKYSQNDRQLDLVILFVHPDIDTWFVQLSPPTVLELQL